jgi:Heterokaryon incompatibility protein (HET)
MPLQGDSIYTFPSEGQAEDHEKFPWLRADWDPSKEDSLCEICRQLNFKHLFKETDTKGAVVSGMTIRLGTIADAKKRKCAFCGFLVDPAHKDRIRAFSRLAMEDNHTIELVCVPQYEGSIALQMSVSHGWLPVGSLRFHRLDEKAASFIGPRRWENQRGIGQRLLPSYSPAQLKRWILECQVEEMSDKLDAGQLDATSRLSTARDAKVYVQRLIDTQQECLVEVSGLSPTHRSYYVTLSYVWGSGQQKTTLTQKSYDMLHHPGSLGAKNAAIPKTIRDAMTVCKDIDMRYLWVDALCIVQDGPDKMDQINKMHGIYATAKLTIVASHGQDADAGLPGVSSALASRQTSIRVQDSVLILEGRSLEDVLDSAIWSSRAWTYQEFLLSSRKLVFSDSLVYFACEHGTYPEDQIRIHKPPARCPGHSTLPKGYKIDWEKLNWTTYADVVSIYSTKNLTHQEDVLSAFTALVETMKREIFVDMPFIWAIPFSCLDAALLWRRCLGCDDCGNTEKGLTRRGKVTTPEGDKLRAPLWSWASRRGHIKYSKWILNHDNPALTIIPRVHWLEGVFLGTRPTEIHTARSLGKGKSDQPIQSWTLPFSTETSTFDAKKSAFKSPTHKGRWLSQPFEPSDLTGRLLMDPYQNFLFLEADTAKFVVAGRLFKFDEAPKERGAYDMNGPIFGAEIGHPLAVYDARTGFRCGVVYDDEELNEAWPVICSFVKLSQTTLSDTDYGELDTDWSDLESGPGKDRLGHVKASKGGPYKDDFHNFFDYDKYDCNRKWPVYNVLMVLWQDGTVAIRLGVGKIHVDAFDNAETFEQKRFYLA